MYRVDHHKRNHRRGHRRLAWLAGGLIFTVLIIGAAVIFTLDNLKTVVTIKQAPAVTTKVTYNTKNKHFDEPNFGIDLPTDWQFVPISTATNHPYRWQGKDGQVIDIYQDTIPANLGVNRILIVEAQVDRLQLSGSVSDNCADFTKAVTGAPGQGTLAKWHGVSFLCDTSNQQPNVIGTSSADGVNIVRLKLPTTGISHSFFFTYISHSINPDYSVFYNALQSLQLQ